MTRPTPSCTSTRGTGQWKTPFAPVQTDDVEQLGWIGDLFRPTLTLTLTAHGSVPTAEADRPGAGGLGGHLN
ncbi:hypothetical protein ACHGLA_00320 [Streptomyces sp. YH02]|uniref:hypothetical protein n=1 Tax=Streptomyces sp. YH02 TaxID=3256999 RepID=UPI003757C0D7